MMNIIREVMKKISKQFRCEVLVLNNLCELNGVAVEVAEIKRDCKSEARMIGGEIILTGDISHGYESVVPCPYAGQASFSCDDGSVTETMKTDDCGRAPPTPSPTPTQVDSTAPTSSDEAPSDWGQLHTGLVLGASPGSFSALSKQNLASKHSFESS